MQHKITTVKNWSYINKTFTKPFEKIHNDLLNVKTEKDVEKLVNYFDSVIEEFNNEVHPIVLKQFPIPDRYFNFHDYRKDNKPKSHLFEHLKIQIEDVKEQEKQYSITLRSGKEFDFTINTVVTHYNFILDNFNELIQAFFALC